MWCTVQCTIVHDTFGGPWWVVWLMVISLILWCTMYIVQCTWYLWWSLMSCLTNGDFSDTVIYNVHDTCDGPWWVVWLMVISLILWCTMYMIPVVALDESLTNGDFSDGIFLITRPQHNPSLGDHWEWVRLGGEIGQKGETEFKRRESENATGWVLTEMGECEIKGGKKDWESGREWDERGSRG